MFGKAGPVKPAGPEGNGTAPAAAAGGAARAPAADGPGSDAGPSTAAPLSPAPPPSDPLPTQRADGVYRERFVAAPGPSVTHEPHVTTAGEAGATLRDRPPLLYPTPAPAPATAPPAPAVRLPTAKGAVYPTDPESVKGAAALHMGGDAYGRGLVRVRVESPPVSASEDGGRELACRLDPEDETETEAQNVRVSDSDYTP